MRKLPFALAICIAVPGTIGAQQTPAKPSPIDPSTPAPAAVTKLSATTYRIGEMTVDTAARTLTVPGTVNEGVSTLEFVANTVRGAKAYETALTLNTNAVSFNAALLLLGLDPSRSKPSAVQFDKTPPEGDPVELTMTWNAGGKPRTVPIEELLLDDRTKKTLPKGPWVYTGSRFYDTGEHRIYLAEQDGVLIGFMHGPQSIIDNPRADALGSYGFYVLNPALGLKPGSPVTVTVKALPRSK
ncbi:MAG TPA: YdjY domain-containing protein [Vicinamibacterales bacterium]